MSGYNAGETGPPLDNRITNVESIAAAAARGRQQMIDALRGIADHPASVWELIRRNVPGQFADGQEHRAVIRAIRRAADHLEAIANQATPDTPTPRGYDYDTEGLGGT